MLKLIAFITISQHNAAFFDKKEYLPLIMEPITQMEPFFFSFVASPFF